MGFPSTSSNADMTAPLQDASHTGSQSRPFEADVAKLLQLIVHSIYSDPCFDEVIGPGMIGPASAQAQA